MHEVIGELQRLRKKGRMMLIAQRVAVLLAWVIGALLALISLDYMLRLPSAFRLTLLLGGVAAFVYFVINYLRAAITFRPSLTQIALRVERIMPGVAGRLASSVEFAAAGTDQSNALAARSVRETQTRLAGESINTVINTTRTWRDLGILFALAGAAVAIVVANPVFALTGLERALLPWSDTKWPARTGVESLMAAVRVHPRGQTLALRANATRGPKDQRVDAHYRLRVDGQWLAWQDILLTHQGSGLHERLIDTNAERLEVYFSTEDDQTTTQEIEIVPPPAVRRASLKVTPPDYAAGRVPPMEAELGQGLDDRAVTDTASLTGSTIDFRLELNKPLPIPSGDSSAWLKTTLGWDDLPPPQIQLDANDPAVWTIHWTLAKTQSLSLHLVDEHGLANSEPIAYRIEAVEDRPPAVTITQPQADQSVLPSAVIALETEGRDDVSLSTLGLEAHVQGKGRTAEEAIVTAPAWSHELQIPDAIAKVQGDLDLGSLHLAEGDVVLVSGVARDVYEAASAAAQAGHTVRSPLRRLRVITETDFATQLRRQLSAVRQNAIRIEALQAELQDDVIENSIQPGAGKAQAQLGERIATQRGSVEQIERQLQQNRLNDPQLAEILQQTQDLLDHAGRAANKAVENIEQRAPAAGDKNAGAAAKPSPGEPAPPAGAPSKPVPSRPQAKPAAGEEAAGGNSGSKPSGNSKPGSNSPDGKFGSTPPDSQAAKPEDKPIVEAQQEVRDELADLIKLLDRDEDTWVVKRQLEDMLQQQTQVADATAQLGQQTMGQKPENLPEQQRTELDRIAQRQRDLRDQARKLTEDLRERGKALDQADPQSAQSMRAAADTAEQQQLDQDMENAAQKAQQNQMTTAQASQEQAKSTMQKMLKDINESKRAQAQQLIRQLTSLIESIQRLIGVQENELTALKIGNDTKDYSGLDRSMIRLNQNTQSVAGEARAAGNEARRAARSLDRAADAQGAAVVAFRAAPPLPADAQAAEDRSLQLLKEAKALAEEAQKKTQDEEVAKRREELMAAYRKFAEQQVVVRGETVKLISPTPLDRRQLVDARRLGSQQGEIRTGLGDLKSATAEIMDSPVFLHVHQAIDRWSATVTESLVAGTVNVDVTDQQQQIADSIGRLIQALEEAMAPPDEFAKEEQQDNQQQGGDQNGPQPQPPLILPVAQLKLLQGLQEQVYNLTKAIDGRTDLDEAQRRNRLRDLGQQQRDLMDLGKQMLEELSKDNPQPKRTPDQPDQPAPPDGGATTPPPSSSSTGRQSESGSVSP